MSLSLYDVSIPVLVRHLDILGGLLTKAEANAKARAIDPSVFVNARLAPDMFPLSRQIQIASDGAKGAGARLAGVEIPSYPDTETSFDDLRARLAKTVDFLKSLDPAAIAGAEDRTIILKLRGTDVPFTARSFLLTFALPNFFFHVVTAYNILRENGVDVGKGDYLGAIA